MKLKQNQKFPPASLSSHEEESLLSAQPLAILQRRDPAQKSRDSHQELAGKVKGP